MRTGFMVAAASALLLTIASCDDDDDDVGRGGSGGSGGSAAGGEGGGGTVGAPEHTVTLELVADGLTSPTVLREAPDGSGRLFIADQTGMIHVVRPSGERLDEPFLDLSDALVDLMEDFDERGLLGLAFHPEYAENGRFFVFYTAPLRDGAPDGFNATSRISEFMVSDDPDRADRESERVLLEIDKPQFNHNGGQIVFGSDGYLYISVGDGGNADDVGLGHVEDWYDVNEGGNGQDIEQNLLGSILRIDVDGDEPYAIPDDNPFADSPMPETWAYGFRNPFRMTFDRGGDGELFVGDVGQNLWEEVNIVESGQNYGWNVKEGTHCFSTENADEELASCPDEGGRGEPLLDPILEYPNAGAPDGVGLSVIGGYVYRGERLPELEGLYVFGDWSASFDEPDGSLFVGTPPRGGSDAWSMAEMSVADRDGGRVGEFVLSFGEDEAGELYLLTTENPGPTGSSGKVYRIVAP